MATEKTTPQLTAREVETIAIAFQCLIGDFSVSTQPTPDFQSQTPLARSQVTTAHSQVTTAHLPQIDYDKMAAQGGWANGASARAFLNKTRAKLRAGAAGAGSGGADPATPKKTPGSAGRKKRAADGEESPTKKSKATPKPKANANDKGAKGAKGKKAADGDEDDEFADVKVKPKEAAHLNDDLQAMIQRDVTSDPFMG